MRGAFGRRNPLKHSLVQYGRFSLYYMRGYGDEKKYRKKHFENKGFG